VEGFEMSWQERQSFLGPDSETILKEKRVAIAGLGGGGSQIGQELAHIGVGHFVLCDFDRYEDKNHNRTVGGTSEDIRNRTLKVEIAKRLIQAINPEADVITVEDRWQMALPQLRGCDAVFGCVDSYSQRDQLENLCRRYHIPYLDVGMDVHHVEHGFAVQGQVILSMPGSLCLRCFNFIRPELLELEAQRYGKAGGRPQVIWPNGTLASTAVGLFMELVTPWHAGSLEHSVIYDYDGNRHTTTLSPRVGALANIVCEHFGHLDNLGDPFWKPAQKTAPSQISRTSRLTVAVQRLRVFLHRARPNA
jgi:molybdopterin/thiamine biosynthesis adenylyltransferase